MIPAALLCVIVAGCADQPPTGPEKPTASQLPAGARTYDVPFDRFFIAWSQSYSSSPIQTQTFALDTRQDRQFAPFEADQGVLSFARSHPGRLYINGDEIDQYCVAPSEYARMYHDFVEAVRVADPTARFSPSGFAEPNDRCCPDPGGEPCRSSMHSISYADQFYNAYVQRYGAAPRVDEWRFHDFGIWIDVGDTDAWWARVDRAAAWSVAHGANMVLGAWGFNAWNESVTDVQERLKRAMGRIMNDQRIKGAVYWSHEPWEHSRHYLTDGVGNLTPAGQTFVNPLTDIATDVKLVGSASGQAKLRWTNTTSAWAAEAEFWVQAPGSSSFVHHNTKLVAGPGGTQTPVVGFNNGDRVKGRVRYYNIYGQAAWSPFSNTVTLALTESEANQSRVFGKRPLFCFLKFC